MPELTLGMAAIGGASMASYFDIRDRTIPNTLSYGLMLCGLLLAVLGVQEWGEALTGMGICGGVALLAYMLGALGGGDVKLLAGIGLLAGGAGAWMVLLVSYALASAAFACLGLYALVLKARGGGGRMPDLSGLPLAPAILIACIVEMVVLRT